MKFTRRTINKFTLYQSTRLYSQTNAGLVGILFLGLMSCTEQGLESSQMDSSTTEHNEGNNEKEQLELSTTDHDEENDEKEQLWTAQVGVWDSESQSVVTQIVEMPPFELENGMLQNNLIHFDKISEPIEDEVVVPVPTLMSDAKGCFCYGPETVEFAYVHTFYYADQILRRYNSALLGRKLMPVSDVKLQLHYFPGFPETGFATPGSEVELDYFHKPIDPYLIAHELGHIVDYKIASQVNYMGDDFEVSEGIANMLAALAIERSDYSRFWRFDGPTSDVDRFIKLPDGEITWLQTVKKFLQAEEFLKVYYNYKPVLEEELEDLLQNGDYIDDYSTSAVINQPIWKIAQRDGFDTAMAFYLETLIQRSTDIASFDEQANLIISTACVNDPDLAFELYDAYQQRGLAVNPPSC